jgi:hypothetical protein
MRKLALLAVTLLALTSCEKEMPEPTEPINGQNCDCGIIVDQGVHNTSTPAGYIIIKNDCTGVEKSHNTGYLTQNHIGKVWCDQTGYFW